jgi:hypothetical protein
MQVGAALLTHPATVLGYVTQVAAVRRAVLAGETLKAVLINTLLPTVLHMQQANCYLPFRHTVPFQLGLFLVAVMWAHGMPCWLPVPGQVSFSNCTCVGVPELAANSSNVPAHITLQGRECEAALAFQQQGTRVCQMIDVLHMLAWSPVGCYADPVSLSTRRLCDGAAAFQLLHGLTDHRCDLGQHLLRGVLLQAALVARQGHRCDTMETSTRASRPWIT